MSTSFLRIGALLILAGAAHADLVMEQAVDVMGRSGTSTTKFRGEAVRVEATLAGLPGTVTIVDLKKGSATVLFPAQKMAMETDFNVLKKQAEAREANPATATKPAPPKATGQKEKIGQWDAEIYEMTASSGPMRLWIAKDFPNGAVIKAEMAKLTTLSGAPNAAAQYADLPGVVVKTEVTTAAGKVSSTLVSVKETPLADADFVVPEGYTMKGGPGSPAGVGAAPAPESGAPAPGAKSRAAKP